MDNVDSVVPSTVCRQPEVCSLYILSSSYDTHVIYSTRFNTLKFETGVKRSQIMGVTIGSLKTRLYATFAAYDCHHKVDIRVIP